jgi:tRNA pseudouridine38-40 synthase
MKRYLITFCYDGSNFKGYQKQLRERTVQGEIEKALQKINSNKKVSLVSSGRTDAGVHALNQKAHFDLKKDININKLKKALINLLPDDIHVKNLEEKNMDFHARYNVRTKEYIYIINLGEYNPLERKYVYQYNKPLDLISIERALKYLEGEHDFKSFAGSDKDKKSYVRTITQANIIKNSKCPDKIVISFVGTGFLKHMIRNIIGTLIQIGEGKKTSENIMDILNKKDRRLAGITANPEGLYLKDVNY